MLNSDSEELRNPFMFVAANASELTKSVYIRWGRTTCPRKETESVYDGFAGGSHYTHIGGASSMMCLPRDPDWDSGIYNDKYDQYTGFIFGTEYEQAKLFGESFKNQDVPCVVCLVRRPSVVMIPGRSKCYDGWTFEYSGYLMTGHHWHDGATDYYCIDKAPEITPGGAGIDYGYLLYFVEARCGSLPCPPYVGGREFQCVVCTK